MGILASFNERIVIFENVIYFFLRKLVKGVLGIKTIQTNEI